MAVSTADFRNGMAIYVDGEVCQITDWQHVKPGKGPAFVRTKLRRLKADAMVEKTFRSGERFDDAFLERKSYQYLYKQGTELMLMDLETYEQIPVEEGSIGDGEKYLKEEMEVVATLADNDLIGYEVPQFVELEVTETDPAFKGDTVSGSNKPATTETGATVLVPYHIKVGDVVKIDTRSGNYLERVKN